LAGFYAALHANTGPLGCGLEHPGRTAKAKGFKLLCRLHFLFKKLPGMKSVEKRRSGLPQFMEAKAVLSTKPFSCVCFPLASAVLKICAHTERVDGA
jgi:hypothetical protein